MKKIILSGLVALALSTTAVAGETTPAFAKADKLKFSGTHYLGYTNKSVDGGDTTGSFEMRRNYVQVKAYLLQDPKDYLRVTLDATYDGSGKASVYVKYAYLYLNDILPSTGVEIGMVHRPWVDYESYQGWYMRSISKVFAEAKESSALTGSADLGVNFKTKTPYFTSEVGVFNGEGYKGDSTTESIGTGMSLEWRATVAALGNGEKKRKATKDTYLDASFFGQYNMDNAANGSDTNGDGIKDTANTYAFYGIHTVYNTPLFLIAAQYITAKNDYEGTSKYNGDGYSVNTTFRFGEKKQYSVIGRFDVWTSEKDSTGVEQTTNNAIYGVAWKQNKNVKWLVSGQNYVAKDDRKYDGTTAYDWSSVMVTAEVKW
ncbi:MAG: hypothetical protein L3I99_00645 [Sulfurimonas sp.]|nr:hypothetical protein [Sulfurimonas sp.]